MKSSLQSLQSVFFSWPHDTAYHNPLSSAARRRTSLGWSLPPGELISRFSLTTKGIKKIKKSFWGVYEYLHIDDPPTLASFDPPTSAAKRMRATVSDRSGFQAIFHQTIIDTLQFQQGSKLQDVGEWSPFVMNTEPLVLSWLLIWNILKIYNVQRKGGKT